MPTIADALRQHATHADGEIVERGPAVLIEAVDDHETLLHERPRSLGTETMQISRDVFSAEALALSEERLGKLQDMVHDHSQVFPLEKTANNPSPNICIGRAGRNDVIIPEASVSSSQATVRFDGDNYSLRDLESANGTFVNRKRLTSDQSKTLHDGDCVRFGARVFYFLHHDTFVLFIELRANRVDLASR